MTTESVERSEKLAALWTTFAQNVASDDSTVGGTA